ncbi:phytanoyl-CoA dioxygenase family protein [Mucilaginibacter sp. UR6-1]|uniref:phytanoyl-CoA dioxygenase family protein n=1 Tax=Mucilaginibacter sp. UR6-1 TaxID=1435643 RepID=UPI001E3FA7E0|nr:phytanoyl-CoA dioxygenase family protein [Mucilaginibacter sp. UR6-1]MCC8407345.1 phytanoyl-CoA dioxygenase family protein [Mucilaginibacter sp. UR6-1]
MFFEADKHKHNLRQDGFTMLPLVFTAGEIKSIEQCIASADNSGVNFRKTADLFAIRRFFNEVPDALPLIMNDRLKAIIKQLFGGDYFIVKSIYFDKPGNSNWFVAYHQDLTIAVAEKHPTDGYTNWTVKQGQYAVQPPLEVLENIYTVRIHLDDTDADNGALKVVAASHNKGIYRPENIDWQNEREHICEVPAGGVMIMQPLLLHASNRTVNNNNRRVIHIEFSNLDLPGELQWAEQLKVI